MSAKINSKPATSPPPELRPRSAPIIERAPLPIVEVQGTMHIVSYVNTAFCSLLEKPRKDLIGKPFCKIVPGGDECVPVLDRVYKTGQAVTHVKEDDSEPAHWLYAMWPALDEDERPTGVIIQLTKAAQFRQNITEVNDALLIAGLRQHEMTAEAEHLNTQLRVEIADRSQAEEKLRVSEEQTKRARDYAEATLRTAPIPLVILRADLRVNTTNEAFCKTFQVEPGEAQGQLIYDLGNRQWNIPELRELLENILPKNKVFNDFEVTHEFETIGRRTMLLNARRMENQTGQPLRIVLAIEDITQRKLAEEALRASEERYRNLFNSMDEGFCLIEMIFDEQDKPVDYRFLEVNPSFETQSGLHEATGKTMRELAPDHEAHWFEIYGKVALTGEPIRFTNEAKALQRWFDVYGFRLGGTESRKVAVLFKDITHRRNNEEMLKKAKELIDHHAEQLEKEVAERTAELKDTNEQLAAFVYSIAHDLRAPLRSMQGFSQLLMDDYGKSLDETANNFLKRINASSEFMDKMIMDLLAFGATGGIKKGTSDLGPVNVQTAWDSALYQYASEIERTKAQIETIAPLPMVRAHEATLAQVFANLLSNALKFMPEGVPPRIRFWAEDFDKNVRIWIQDNGMGIPPEHHVRIYRVFERLHGGRYPGTGIGLSIVRKGVERMGGLLGLDSTPGKGSKFCVELPKA